MSRQPAQLKTKFLSLDVEAVARTLSLEERNRAIVLVPSYGQAGALELLGRGRNLPPVSATQNNYHHRRPVKNHP